MEMQNSVVLPSPRHTTGCTKGCPAPTKKVPARPPRWLHPSPRLLTRGSDTTRRLPASTHRTYRFTPLPFTSHVSLWLCAESYTIAKINLKEICDLMEIIYGRVSGSTSIPREEKTHRQISYCCFLEILNIHDSKKTMLQF